jgi:ribosomal-protein-alanine N-acetyltransferase
MEGKKMIRWITSRDLHSIVKISQQTETGLEASEILTWMKQLNTVGVAYDNDEGELIGFAFWDVDEDDIRLTYIAVDEKHRNQGVGSRLISRLFPSCSRRKVKPVRCVVPEDFLDFQLFLRNYGFRAVGVSRRHFGDLDGYEMVCKERCTADQLVKS